MQYGEGGVGWGASWLCPAELKKLVTILFKITNKTLYPGEFDVILIFTGHDYYDFTRPFHLQEKGYKHWPSQANVGGGCPLLQPMSFGHFGPL